MNKHKYIARSYTHIYIHTYIHTYKQDKEARELNCVIERAR